MNKIIDKKAQATDKLMIVIIVLAVVAIVLLGIFKFDIIGKIKNIFPSFNQTEEPVDLEKCKVMIAKVQKNAISHNQINFCKLDDKECSSPFGSAIFLNKENKLIIDNEDLINSNKVIGGVYSNIIYLDDSIIKMQGDLYYDVGIFLPTDYEYTANLEGATLMGKYICRDLRISFNVPEGYEQIGEIAFYSDGKYDRKWISLFEMGTIYIYFSKEYPTNILIGEKIDEGKIIASVSGNKINLVPKENMPIDVNVDILSKLDGAEILGDKIIKKKIE